MVIIMVYSNLDEVIDMDMGILFSTLYSNIIRFGNAFWT